MTSINNPLTPFTKGDFFDAPFLRGIFPQVPLRKGGFRGLSNCHAFNFEIPVHEHKYKKLILPTPLSPPRRGLFDSPLERGKGCVIIRNASQNTHNQKIEIPYVYI